MTEQQQHPITPPPELVEQWVVNTFHYNLREKLVEAVRWGADQELEACCEWIREQGYHSCVRKDLHLARRPKPPSLKEQAYDTLDKYIYGNPDPKDKQNTYNIIRRALEQLPNSD